ncbi:MAG: tandem-95 repeat protein, partial [Candidatus Krumholzibacteriia bacterium]
MSLRPRFLAAHRTAIVLALLTLVTGLHGGPAPALAITPLPVLTQVGPVAGAQLGLFVSSIGDFNGDGWPDFVVGAPFAAGGGVSRGEAWLYWGGPGLDATPDLVLRGEASYDQFGNSARGCGDLNGDGWNDLLVGAPNNDSAGNNAGRAYVYFGGPTANAVPDLILVGRAANEQFGWAVAGPGDLDGGGPDFVVGAPGAQSAAGRAYVFQGGAALDTTADFIIQGPPGVRLGWFMDRAGDFDADGWPDLLVGANFSLNAWLYRGGPAFDTTADFIFKGEVLDDRFGYGLAAAGDVNGDGHDDIIIGAMHNDAGGYDAGRAYLYYGGPAADTTADLIFTGTDYRGLFGRTVAGAGDLNADGYDDLIIGAPTPDFAGYGPGRMYVFLGGDPHGPNPPDAVPDAIITGENDSDRLGAQLSLIGDVNGDGRDEFAVGANLFDAPNRTDAGKVYVYRIPNEMPVAVADSASVLENAAVTIAVLANDFDPDGTLVPATVRVVAPPAHGAAVVDTASGDITYTPVFGFAGADTFHYDVRDNEGALAGPAIVAIAVTPVNAPPVALADTFAVDENATLVVAAPGVLANDTDADGDPLTAEAALAPLHGALTLAGDGGFTYQPQPHFAGVDSFAYRAFDGAAWSDTARVHLEVRPVNAPPVALPDSAVTAQDAGVSVPVLANDSDPDGTLVV